MHNKHTSAEIYSYIKERILNGIFSKDSLLPTETTLALNFSVSRPTIAKAYNRLQKEGYIEKKKGIGSTVLYESNKIYSFGLLLPGSGESEIFSAINDQLLRVSEKGEFNLLWEGATASSADTRKKHIFTCCELYINKKVDGIFFAPLERTADAVLINQLICKDIQKANIPLVLIDRSIHSYSQKNDFDLVGLNNFEAGYLMAQHLIDSGCENVYFFHLPHSATSVKLRIAGVQKALSDYKIFFCEEQILCANPFDLKIIEQIKITNGRTGIICANDVTAAALMSSLEQLHLVITKDLVICGFDDMKYSSQLKYPLTTYSQPSEDIANVSIELMMRRLKNKNCPPVTVSLSGELIIRNSSIFIKKDTITP